MLAFNTTIKSLSLSAMVILSASMTQAASLHDDWDQLLEAHVTPIHQGHSTQINYQGVLAERAQLDGYLGDLAQVSQATFDKWSRDDQLAFLINAYNAYTVQLIIDNYDGLASIRDLGGLFSSPWKKEIAPLLGKTRTLDEIEHELIRGSGLYNEPRIHFAVNCASIGCPSLREEAYRGSQLEQQLEAQTKRFIADITRNYLDNETLHVSKIFDWYQDDFEMGWRDQHSLEAFFASYAADLNLSEQTAAALKDGDVDIKFLKYDWALNDVN